MFGDNPFAVPISSFQRPVPLVLVDPDDEPDYNVCFRKEWLPYILACLQQLWLQTTWKTDDPDALALVQSRAKQLTSLFMRGCDTCVAELPESSGCVSIGTNSPIITYAPQDPFVTPEYIPPGYIAVPFIAVTPGDILSFFPGVEIGDVISGYLSIPVTTPGIGEGLARFRVRTRGTGVVELHLLKIPGGGAVLITTDDDPLTVRTINLSKDITQLPIETVTEITIEVPITTSGDHHVDVTFVPRFNDELLFISYGGGLRSVVLCGFDETLDQITEDRAREGAISINEDEFDMGLRISPDDPCVIQRECSPGEWVDWYDPRGCIPGLVTQPGGGGTVGAGGCDEFDLIVQGNGKTLLPVPVSAGYTLEITGASGGWSYNNVDWRCPNGQQYTLGFCSGAPAVAGGGYPMPSQRIGRLIVDIDGTFYDADNTSIVVPNGVSSTDVYFQMNDTDLTDNFGSVSLHVKVCNRNEIEWEHVFDFTISDHGWYVADDGEYVPGVGFRSVPQSGSHETLYLQRDHAARFISFVEVFYECEAGRGSPPGGRQITVGAVENQLEYGAGVFDTDFDTNIVSEHFILDISSNGTITDVNILTKIIVRGTGTDPF